jgi:KDO2-lipid IV(A) lauroyltransferase
MDYIIFKVASGIIFLISRLPLKVHYKLSRAVAVFLFGTLRYRRSVIITNLARAFPELKYKELNILFRDFVEYISAVFAENIWAVSRNDDEVAKLGHIENPEILRDIFSRGKSVIVACAHSGNWELMGLCDLFSTEGNTGIGFDRSHFAFAYKKQKGALGNKLSFWMRSKRAVPGKENENLVESKNLVRYVIRNKSVQKCYFLIADQFTHHSDSTENALFFLNQHTTFLSGPASLSRLTGIPVVFAECFGSNDGGYRVRFHLIADDPKTISEGEITKRYAVLLERAIKEKPYNWLWSHRRWK